MKLYDRDGAVRTWCWSVGQVAELWERKVDEAAALTTHACTPLLLSFVNITPLCASKCIGNIVRKLGVLL